MKVNILVLLVIVALLGICLAEDKPAEPAPATTHTDNTTATPSADHIQTKPAESAHTEPAKNETHEAEKKQPAKTPETVENKTANQTNQTATAHPTSTDKPAEHPTSTQHPSTPDHPAAAQHPTTPTSTPPTNTDHKPQTPTSTQSTPTAVHPQGAGQHPINTDHPSAVLNTTPHVQTHNEPPSAEPLSIDLNEPTSTTGQYDVENDAIIKEILKKQGLENKQEVQEEMKAEDTELKAQKEEITQLQEQLDEWVLKEKHEFEEAQAFHVSGQRFQFSMAPTQVHSFWYDTATNKPGNDIHIDIAVYHQLNNTFYTPTRPQQTTNLKFTIVSDSNRVLIVKNIYITYSMEFRPPQLVGYYLHFENNYDKTIMVLVNIERMNKTVEGVSNTHLDPLVGALSTALDEMEKNYNDQMRQTYKSEMGFKEREEEHMSTMLMLTGVELLAILSTAVIQMFCLRNLLDNRSIV